MSAIPLYNPNNPLFYCTPEVFAFRAEMVGAHAQSYDTFCGLHPEYCTPQMVKEAVLVVLQQAVHQKHKASLAHHIITTRSAQLMSVINDKDVYGLTLLCYAVFAFNFAKTEALFNIIGKLLSLGASPDVKFQTNEFQLAGVGPVTTLHYLSTKYLGYSGSYHQVVKLILAYHPTAAATTSQQFVVDAIKSQQTKMKASLQTTLSSVFKDAGYFFHFLPSDLRNKVACRLSDTYFIDSITFDGNSPPNPLIGTP